MATVNNIQGATSALREGIKATREAFATVHTGIIWFVAQAFATGDAAALKPMLPELAKLPTPDLRATSVEFIELATGCKLNAAGDAFEGEPEPGDGVTLKRGTMRVNGKAVVWWEVAEAREKAKQFAKREAAKAKPKAVDVAKAITGTANRIRKADPVKAQWLDLIARADAATLAKLQAGLADNATAMPQPQEASEANAA